jgi:hypothetical protein
MSTNDEPAGNPAPRWGQHGSHARTAKQLCVALTLAVSLSACSGADVATETIARPGLGCIDDSPRCIAERGTVLKTYMADRNKAFLREPASPSAYASGVRLWAIKSRKRELTCDELNNARREADAAAPTLRGPGGQGMTPAQISRGIMLAQDVSKEIGNEHGRRCRA